MMERLLKRGAAIAAREAELVGALLEQAARDELPADVRVERTSEGVVILGRRLGMRLLRDARFRGIGTLARGVIR